MDGQLLGALKVKLMHEPLALKSDTACQLVYIKQIILASISDACGYDRKRWKVETQMAAHFLSH